MGSAERRLRHRAELRAAILDAALEIVAAQGLGGLSIRAIADRIEYSAATIYLYFDSKEALLREVAREGFHRLLESLRDAMTRAASDHDPAAASEALRAAARAYIDFALEHAAYFRAMFEPCDRTAAAAHPHPGADDECCYRSVVDQVERTAGLALSSGEASAETVAALATVHGLVSLYLSGRIEDLARTPAELTGLVERCMASREAQGGERDVA